MQITKQLLCEALEAMDLVPRPYSGRGMHGDLCVSVNVGRERPPYGFALALALEMMSLVDGAEEAADVVEALAHTPSCTDDMGLDYVVYWPFVAWDEEEQNDTDVSSAPVSHDTL